MYLNPTVSTVGVSQSVLASSYLNMKGNTITTYIVQQKHSIFWGLVTWWTIENIGDEWSSGSIYDTLEEADQYIKSLVFDRKHSKKISNAICQNSTDRDVKFEV